MSTNYFRPQCVKIVLLIVDRNQTEFTGEVPMHYFFVNNPILCIIHVNDLNIVSAPNPFD